jgi:hypothetical protein
LLPVCLHILRIKYNENYFRFKKSRISLAAGAALSAAGQLRSVAALLQSLDSAAAATEIQHNNLMHPNERLGQYFCQNQKIQLNLCR